MSLTENKKRSYPIRIFLTVLGIFVYAFGVQLTIFADVGMAPWDVLFVAIAGKLGVSYGTVAVPTNVLILGGALLLKEKIGLATVLDTVLSGLFVDFFALFIPDTNPYPYFVRYSILAFGMVVMSVAIFLYMQGAIGCGPKDSLMLGFGKRLKKVPVGVARIFIDCTVLIAGFIIDPSLAGIGTAVAAFGFGVVMTLFFMLIRFEPKSITHESILTTAENIFAKKE